MRLFILYIIISIFFLPSAFGQLTEYVVKANFILNMSKLIEWEEEDTIQRYNIGVFGGDEIFEALDKRSREILFKGKSIDVVQFKRINQIQDVHILFVEKKRNHTLERILDFAIANQILLFSDSCSNYAHTMINFLALDMPGNQFEINKENLNKAKLNVPLKLLYFGGSAKDLREMYQASELELSNVQESLSEQKTILVDQRAELDLKKREILALNEEIFIQEKRLKTMIVQATAQQDSLDQKVALLDAQKRKIIEQQADIDKQNTQLQGQIREIEEGNTFLKQQKQEIQNQEEKIKKQQGEVLVQTQTLERQNSEIEEHTLKIEKQQTILYFFIAIFILIAAMIFFILRAYRIKKLANKKLEEKNAAIIRQKEEIQSQQDQLKITHRKIEKQNENIKSSIHYALTIQQALLPPKEEIAKLFESFIVYRPRDIVSGDFYWMSHVLSDNGASEMTFFVVADCTGHGVPGAFLSMIGIKVLSSIINERKEYNPKVILEMLNVDIQVALQQEKMGSDDGMDVCLCRIEKTDEGRYKIIYSGARRPLYYSSNQKINILRGDRKTVGGRFFKKQVFTNRELYLDAGDRIYLCSDGIADQNASNRQKFGSVRLVKLLENSTDLTMAEQKEVLEITLDDFQENEKQRDDISLMAIKL